MARYDSLAGSDRDALNVGTYELDYRRPEYLRETSNTKLVKNNALSHLITIDRSAGGLASTARPLRHFYLRSVVGLLGPCIVLFYFMAIWRVYLAPLDGNNPLAFGAPGATWVYYSWFVAGVIGLNLSTYGLAGIEAAMLMEPRWNVKDAMRLMMHADVTWSGPGGWMKTVKWIVQTHRSDGPKKLPGCLWFLLAFPSILVFIAWPLSGLCFETTDGFLHGTPGDGSQVIGFSYSNFNERNFDDAYKGAGVTWSNSLDSRIPGQGAAYTPEGFDRSEHNFLEEVPVILPKDDGLSRTFLTAQATTPIEGSAWGLLLQYNCSIVDKLSDLSILKDRKPATENGILNATQGIRNYYLQGNSSQVFVQNQTNLNGGFQAGNIHAVAEMAYQIWPSREAQMRQLTSSTNGYFSKTSGCYYNQDLNITGDYPGVDQERIFEMVLWQHIYNSSFGDATPPKYNYSLDRSIAELYGAYDYNNFQYTVPANISKNFKPAPMTAIGVQCRSSSSVGTAQINGVHSTYSNFTRTDTPINVQRARCAGRFGAETLGSMIPKPASITSSNPLDGDWLNSLFTSVAAPPLFYATYTDDPNSIDAGTGYMVRLGYLQASQLRQSLLRAYAAYAVQLMYNGGQGFTTREGSEVSFTNPNVTSFVAGTVIKQGSMHVGVPLAFFALWALVSTSLCAAYGFRKRWTEILDGHTLFRLGVDLDEEDRGRIQRYSNTGEVETSIGLNEIPGLVGDTRPNDAVGRIGLVEESVAVKRKLYY